jgi:hypothetical protein
VFSARYRTKMKKLFVFASSFAFVACVAITLYHRDRLITNQTSVVLEEHSSVQARINSVVKKAGKKSLYVACLVRLSTFWVEVRFSTLKV